jgi:hypothetical protein
LTAFLTAFFTAFLMLFAFFFAAIPFHLLLQWYGTFPQALRLLARLQKRESRGSTEPRLTTNELEKDRRSYYLFFFAAGFFLAAVFFAAFFLAAIIHYLLRFFYDPIGFISETHRASPRNLNDEDSETLAVVRNGSRTRVV